MYLYHFQRTNYLIPSPINAIYNVVTLFVELCLFIKLSSRIPSFHRDKINELYAIIWFFKAIRTEVPYKIHGSNLFHLHTADWANQSNNLEMKFISFVRFPRRLQLLFFHYTLIQTKCIENFLNWTCVRHSL